MIYVLYNIKNKVYFACLLSNLIVYLQYQITIEPAATDKRHKVMITINQVVFNKKGQKGTITRIITKSTGYVEVSYEAGFSKKEMAFNLTDENGVSLKKSPKKAELKALTPLEEIQNKMMWINGCASGDRNSMSYQISAEMLSKIEMKAKESGNDFIVSICQSVDKYMKCSEKQAHCLAKFAIENEIKL